MPRKAFAKPPRGGTLVRAAIAVLAMLVLARTAWQVPRQRAAGEQGRGGVATAAAKADPRLVADAQFERARRAEIERVVAEVATVCPASALQLQQQLTASPAYDRTAYRSPTARATIASITAVQREASNSPQEAGEWLIDPGQWFVPEDSANATSGPEVGAEPLAPAEADPPLRLPAVPDDPAEPTAGDAATEPSPPSELDGPAFVTPFEPPPQPQASEPWPPAEEERAANEVVESQQPEPQQPEPQPPQAEQQVELSPERDEPPMPPAVEADSPPAASKVEPSTESSATPEELPPRQPLFAPPVAPTEKTQPAIEPVAPEAVPPPTAGTEGSSFPPPALPSPHSPGSLDEARAKAAAAGIAAGTDPHAELYAEGCYPSAKTCAKCHEKIYHEWSMSSHAYAFVSPMFHKFEQKISEVSLGTVGYFCQRCHSPVGTSLSIPRDMPLWAQPEVAREGVTCVACHRVNQRFGKSNGERHIVPGDAYAPVYGGKGGVGVAEVIAQKEKFKVKTSPNEPGPGQAIHTEGRYFDQLSASEYCTTCHQVAVHPGIKLEVVWEQYRASPAFKAGITCQDCHMGKVPGVPSGYECCAIAEVAGQKVRDNVKHSNHTFYGPGYSIAHPGIFPFHLKADRWKFDEWLLFDWRAGWGTDEFEQAVDAGEIRATFPKVWAEADDRYYAREIIDDNLKKLAAKTEIRKAVMENGSRVEGPFFDTQPSAGHDLSLHYVVANTNSGHNLPTASLGAQPQLWANVVLIGPCGERLWESGYNDRYGDVCDIHSRDVRAGRVPFDSQLFNLQTMFLITGAVGTDREFFLPVNVDFDQLPFLRPGAVPISVLNHPPFIRMESRSLAPLGQKKVKYRIPGHLLREPGRYRLSFRMRSRAEPIYFMDFCGATIEMQRAMNEGIIDVHPYSVEFDVR